MRLLLFAALASVAASPGRTIFAQAAAGAGVAEVRQTLDSARKEVDAYTTAGGESRRAGAPRDQMGLGALGVP